MYVRNVLYQGSGRRKWQPRRSTRTAGPTALASDDRRAAQAQGRRAAHVRDTRRALLDTARQLFTEDGLPGHPHRGGRPAGRADPGRALPPLPRQGRPLPGGPRGGRGRGLRRCCGAAPATCSASAWELFRANSEIYLAAAAVNPSYRQIVPRRRSRGARLDGVEPSGATAPRPRSPATCRDAVDEGSLDPQPVEPLAHLLSALGAGSAMYVAHAEDPERPAVEVAHATSGSSPGSACTSTRACDRAAVDAQPRRPAVAPQETQTTTKKENQLMAWDFSTEPEFQEKLDWATRVRRATGRAARPALPAPAVPSARRRAAPHRRPDEAGGARPGPVGRAPRARARRQGVRPAQAGPAQRDPRRVGLGAHRLRHPGPRHGQRRDHRPLRHRGAEGEVPPAAPQRRGASPATR